MAYDIPDEIKYREKILLNLDLKQLGYIILFGIMGLLLYNLPIEGDLQLILPAIAAFSGLAFVFFNIEERVLDIIAYYRNVRKAGPYDLKAQNFIGVKAVKNHAICLDNYC